MDTDGVPCTEYTCYTTQRIRIVTNRAESSKPVIDNRARAYSDSRVSPSTLQEMDDGRMWTWTKKGDEATRITSSRYFLIQRKRWPMDGQVQ